MTKDQALARAIYEEWMATPLENAWIVDDDQVVKLAAIAVEVMREQQRIIDEDEARCGAVDLNGARCIKDRYHGVQHQPKQGNWRLR